MAVLLELYWTFIKVGLGSPGGGAAAFTIMERELVPHWLSQGQLADMISVGSMLPGPFAVVTTVMAGYHIGGVPCSIAALAGLLTPPTLMVMTVAIVVKKFSSAGLVGTIQQALRPGAIGLVVVACFTVGKGRITDPITVAMAVAAFGLFMWKKDKIHPALLILAFGILGMILLK